MQGFSEKLTAYDFLGMLIPGIVVVSCSCMLFYSSQHDSCLSFYFELIALIDKFSILCDISIILIFLAVAYICGLAVNTISDWLFNWFRNNDKHIIKAAKKLISKGHNYRFIEEFYNMVSESGNTECEYYRMYYWLMWKNKTSSAIPVLESQVVFVRNMLIPTLLLISVTISKDCMTVLQILFIVLFISEFAILFSRQERIYSLILEDYQWYKELESIEK